MEGRREAVAKVTRPQQSSPSTRSRSLWTTTTLSLLSILYSASILERRRNGYAEDGETFPIVIDKVATVYK